MTDPAAVADVRSPLSDGEWHRLHPLTPVLRGGLFLLVVLGIVITNLRDRIIGWLVPGLEDWERYEADPVDYVVSNNLVLLALLAVLGVLLLLLGGFWLSWRFHTFRITGDDVEVRSGILFRTHRRAPLDRVQGVNLTRPMVARLLGAAKLEVVGAGLDANVKLEYLSTANAEAVRADILRLASGRQLARAADAGGPAGRGRAAVAAVSAGLTGLIDGAEQPVAEPASVVHIPPGRLIASRLLSGSTLWLLLLAAAIVVGAIVGTPWVLFTLVPAILGFGAYWFRTITRALRYSIAPTPSGVRITFGLFTTITETLPPGRVHAFEIRQPLLWRGFGWWAIRVNRLSGRSANDAQSQQFADVLPVGTRDDVERVLRLFLPGISAAQWQELVVHGLLGPHAGDPYVTTPRRAWWLRPLSWRRNGVLLTPDALLLRRGMIWRSLIILPLARLQSVGISQGPLDRARRVANLTGHTVAGQVAGAVGIIDRDDAYGLWQRIAAAVIAAAATDRSHRWDAEPPRDAEPGDGAAGDAGVGDAGAGDAGGAEDAGAGDADAGAGARDLPVSAAAAVGPAGDERRENA
ncbi:PH domain-containing protein [Microbacterium hominis]|uniref:PH domain-containing protein n=1 Tax=Microbacterium hominis TaxID=162426 RepID=UPI001F06CF3A|nr:PH domain-containing protein [Microbacterium hominis]